MHGLFLLLMPPLGYAEQGNIVVFSSGSAPVYRQVATQLKSSLNEKCTNGTPACIPYQVYIINQATEGTSLVIPPRTKLIITLGQRAGEIMSAMNMGIPVLYALIPRAAYRQLTTDKQHSAIYLDQPTSRQLQLAKIIRSDAEVGLLLSAVTQPLKTELITAAGQQNISVHYRDVESTAMVGPRLKEVLEESNVFLALPDPTIFNRATIFNILLSSYHNKVPVIGFSSAYVKAGALVAAYSTPEDIARHLAEYISDYLNSGAGALPEPIYPKYFSVTVNQSVARSLGISLPDENDIIRRILEDSKP